MFKNEHILTDEQAEILGIWQEEASEVIQELSKIRRSGPDFCRKGTDVPNLVHLQHEVLDLLIMMELALEVGLFKAPTHVHEMAYRKYKLEKLKNWSGLGNVIQRVQERNSL